MNAAPDFCPEFQRPPVLETKIGVQFAPLTNFQSGHFGLFWSECLGIEKWRIREDLPALPKEVERFDSKILNPPMEESKTFPQVRMRLSSENGRHRIQFQPNKIHYAWAREDGPRPTYSEVRTRFVGLFGQLEQFVTKWKLGMVIPDLWEVSYLNQIPPGPLWEKPSDWHRVLPGLFRPGGPQITGCDWSTFNGEWYFEIPPQLGRVVVRVQKAVSNLTGEVVLLLNITARGPVGTLGIPDWSSGIDLGHKSAVRAFYDLVSSEARTEWGVGHDQS